MGEREQSVARQISGRVDRGENGHSIRRGSTELNVKEVAQILHELGIHIDRVAFGRVGDVEVIRFETSRYEEKRATGNQVSYEELIRDLMGKHGKGFEDLFK